MKKILIVLTVVLLSLPAFSQAPSKMSYQAVVRNSLNSLVTNRPVSMRVSILRGSASGIPVYVETQTSNTNDNGLLTLQIGNGTVLSGNIDSVDWSTNQYFIKTETDPNGGVNYSIVGTSQLLSVPYALYAKSAGNAVQGPQGPQGMQGPQGPPGTAGITTSVNNVQHVNGNITLTQANIGLGNVDNTADINKPISTAAQTAIDLKSDINSPTFSGTPIAPTPAPGTNTNQLSTTAFVQDAVSSSMAVDATTSSTGKVRLAGDLGGVGSTAAAPIISNNAITSSKIQNGTITNSDISSSAAIPFSKLNISYTDITSLGIPGTDTDTQYGAGTGLSLTGTTFNIDPSVVTNNYPGTVTATGFIGDGSQLTNIAATSVANNSVTSAKIVDGTIGNADISSSAAIPFTKLNISYNDITSLGIPGTDTDTQYGAGTGLSLTGTTFNIDPSVVTNNYPGTVTATGFVGDGSQLTNIAATSVANNSVTSAKIVDGTIGNADISSSAAIPFTKLNISYNDITSLGIPGTDTDTQYGAGTGLSLTGTTFNIDPSVVTNNYPGTVTATGFVGDGSQLTNIAATSVANNSVTSAKIVDGTIGNADISSAAAIPFSKLNISYTDITSLGIPGTDTDTQYGAGTGLTLSGTTFNIDPSVVTNNYPGNITANAFIGDGSQLLGIIATTVDDNIVSSSKITDGTIMNIDISPTAAIPFSKLDITYNDITSLGIPGTDTQYGAGTGISLTGTTFSIDPSVVTNNYSGTVTATGFVGDGSQLTNVAATSVANNSVTSAKIVDGTIGNADISSSAAIPFTKLNISYNDITSLGIPGTDTDTQYGAGTGISLTGTTFSIDPSVVTNNYSGTVTATGFIGDGSQLTNIAATSVANNSVTSAKIVDGTIGNADISSSAAIPFTKLNISYNDITSLGIPGTDTDTQYGAGTGISLTGTTFSIDPSVVTNNYSGTVTATGFIGDGSQLTNIAATSVANNSVTSAKIVDGTIGNADISSSAAIPFTKLNISYNDITSLGIPGTDTDTQYGAGTGISLTGTTFSIDPSVVTNNYSGTVTATGFIGDGSQLTNIAATSVANNSVTSAKIVDGTIGNADISSSAAIPFTKLNISYNDITSLGIPGTDTDTQYGAGTGISLTGTTFSIDPSVVTNNYSGTVTATGFIGDGSQLTNIAATSVANNSVTSAKIVDGTISNADISSSAAIPFTKLNISYNDITSLGIPGTDTDTQYGAGTGLSLSGTTFNIDASVVTNNYSGTVTATGFIGDGSQLTNVAASSVANNSVTSATINDGTITNADIATSAAIPFSKLNVTKTDLGVYSSKLDAAGSIIQSSVTASPTHTANTGIYQISYPTLTFTAPIITATLQSIGFITATYSGGGVFTIATYDITGTPTDLDFSMIVMEP